MAPLQPYQPDIAGSYARGLQIREALEASRDRDRKRRGRDALEAGDMETFAKLDPEGASVLMKNQREASAAELSAASTMQQMGERDMQMQGKREENTRGLQERVATALRNDPATAWKWQQVIDQRARGRNPAVNQFDIPGEEQMAPGAAGPPSRRDPTAQEIESMRLGAGGKDERTGDQKDFAYGEQNPEFRAYEMSKKPAGTTVNNNVSASSGGPAASPLTTANTTAQQEKLTSTRESKWALQGLKKMGDPGQFLGALNGAGNWTLAKLDKYVPGSLSPDQEKALGQATVYKQRVEQFFNAYRKLITGAGASVGELNMLRDSVLNSDLSPAQFRAVMDDAISRFEDDEQISSNILKRGIQFGSDDYKEEYAKLRESGLPSRAAGAAADVGQAPATVTSGKGKNAKTTTIPGNKPSGATAEQMVQNAIASGAIAPDKAPELLQALRDKGVQ